MYKDFAQYYGFSPLPCRVASPNDKGKVESGIKFVKDNFFKGRTFTGGTDLDIRLRNWNIEKNLRIHGTTRKVPHQVFLEEEKTCLCPLPPVRFSLAKISTRKVYHDCHIYVDYNYYSVPYAYVGKTVDVEVIADCHAEAVGYQFSKTEDNDHLTPKTTSNRPGDHSKGGYTSIHGS